MISVHNNGIKISVQQLPKHKRKGLIVEFDNEPASGYKVATFDSNEQADWFEEILQDMFRGVKATDE